MKKQFLHFLKYFSKQLSVNQLIRWSKQPWFLPFYHTVGEANDLPHIRHLYLPRTVKEFEKDLDFMLKNFEAVGLPPTLKGGFALTSALKVNSETSFPFRGRGGENAEKVPNLHPPAPSRGTKLGDPKDESLEPSPPLFGGLGSIFYLTLDDGLSEVYHVIAPILKRKGIPATFFLNPNFIDNKGLFFRYKASLLIDYYLKNGFSNNQEKEIKRKLSDTFKISDNWIFLLKNINFQNQHLLDDFAEIIEFDFQDFLKKRQPYLTFEQIKNLQKDGFHFGGHSLNHPLFSEISLEEQLQQAGESVAFIKENFGEKIGTFAFPFTDFGVREIFFDKAKNNNLFDLSFGTAGLKIDSQNTHYQRFPMEGKDWSAEELVKTEYLYFILKRLVGKHKIKRR